MLLLLAVKEVPGLMDSRRLGIRVRELASLPRPFWWAILIASLLSLARFSPVFLILKAHEIGVDAAFVPTILAVMFTIYSLTAYHSACLRITLPAGSSLASAPSF